MSLQLYKPDQPPQVIPPPSDIEKLKSELLKIDNALKAIEKDKSSHQENFDVLKSSLENINEIIFSLDNSNDFFKIGGFTTLVPLLGCPDDDVIAATAELIADLCQNNKYCQSKALEFSILPELVNLLEKDSSKVRSKCLYAVSSLCRHNEAAIKDLESTRIVHLVVSILNSSDEKLKARASFFLMHLSKYETFRDSFYSAGIIGILINLLQQDQDSSTENVLNALLSLVSQHVQSRLECKSKEYNLKEILQAKIDLYNSKEEYKESKEYCEKILVLCFS